MFKDVGMAGCINTLAEIWLQQTPSHEIGGRVRYQGSGVLPAFPGGSRAGVVSTFEILRLFGTFRDLSQSFESYQIFSVQPKPRCRRIFRRPV